MRKRRIKVILAIAIIVVSGCFSSCALLSDPGFYEGFREGWNMTAPPEYRF